MMKDILGVKLYNTEDAATLLGVQRSTICLYIQQGRLQAHTIGKRKYITQENLIAFLQGNNNLKGNNDSRSKLTPSSLLR